MRLIGQWAYSLCIAGVLCSLVLLLSPSKKLEKGLRLASVLLFVICFCTPLAKLELKPASVDISSGSYAYITPQQGLCSGMETLITGLLRRSNILLRCVTVTSDGAGNLTAALVLSDPSQAQAARLLVESEYAIAVTISSED